MLVLAAACLVSLTASSLASQTPFSFPSREQRQNPSDASTFPLAWRPPPPPPPKTDYTPVFAEPDDEDGDVEINKLSHLSRWARLSKSLFLDDVKDGKEGDWVIVMGNEAGDLDSMTSALSWAYHLSHRSDVPKIPAIALLQTHLDAIDLRPENKLALHNAGMEAGHRDLLTIDELPVKPSELGPRLRGVVLVDHNRLLQTWGNTTVLGVIDHHSDWGQNPSASPRVIEPSGSCSSLVTRQLLQQSHSHGPIPKGLADLIVSVIALDTGGLAEGKAKQVDWDSAKAMWPRSHYSKEKFSKVIEKLDEVMSKAKKDLGHASVRDLLRRDWKGDIVHTPSDTTPDVHLGFASVPVSFQDMIDRTPEKTPEGWFAVEQGWAEEGHVDIAVALTSFKEKHDGEKQKFREIVLVVRSGHRINDEEAASLFDAVTKEVEASDELELSQWGDGKDLGKWRRVWVHNRKDGGRKIIRPIVERAVKNWHREEAARKA